MMETIQTAQDGLPTVAARAPMVKRIKAGDPLASQNASIHEIVRCSDFADLMLTGACEPGRFARSRQRWLHGDPEHDFS
jgi:hypothetical protein